jgi:hypothetical protein
MEGGMPMKSKNGQRRALTATIVIGILGTGEAGLAWSDDQALEELDRSLPLTMVAIRQQDNLLGPCRALLAKIATLPGCRTTSIVLTT